MKPTLKEQLDQKEVIDSMTRSKDLNVTGTSYRRSELEDCPFCDGTGEHWKGNILSTAVREDCPKCKGIGKIGPGMKDRLSQIINVQGG